MHSYFSINRFSNLPGSASFPRIKVTLSLFVESSIIPIPSFISYLIIFTYITVIIIAYQHWDLTFVWPRLGLVPSRLSGPDWFEYRTAACSSPRNALDDACGGGPIMCEGAGERVSCVTRRARLMGEWVVGDGVGESWRGRDWKGGAVIFDLSVVSGEDRCNGGAVSVMRL
jgi:hypothetical protein